MCEPLTGQTVRVSGGPSESQTPRPVVIVDDDDWSRAGLTAIFGADARLDLRAALTHDEALTSDDWISSAEVVIVDAADDRRTDDQFPGVGVVEKIRAQPGRQPTVIVVTGYFWDAAVRKRMREAGADLIYYRPEIQEAARIREIVLHPEREQHGVPAADPSEDQFRMGIGSQTQVNAFVNKSREFDWLGGDLFRKGRRTRSFDRHRTEAARVGRVHAVNADGTPPDREQDVPGRPQLARLLDWATRVPHQRRPGSGGPTD